MAKRLYTHSSSRSYRACNYQWWIAYVLGIRAKKTAKALTLGTIVHAALEAYWLFRKTTKTEYAAGALAAAVAAIDAEATLDPFEKARLRVMVITYAAIWNTVACEVLAVEAKFVHPLYNPETREASETFDRAGKIDLIVRMEDGKVILVEHKTSSFDVGPGSDYRRRLILDEQISFYHAGGMSLGFKPDGVIYDVLKKFRVKPKLATPPDKRVLVKDKKTKQMRLKAGQRDTDETPEQYELRLLSLTKDDPEKFVQRIMVQRLAHERKRFALQVWNQAKIMGYALDNKLFPQNSDACFKYGMPCQYASHCYENASLEDPNQFYRLDDLNPELVEEPEAEEADDNSGEEAA